METVYLIMSHDDSINKTTPVIGFTDKDLAIIHCAKFNIDNQDTDVAYFINNFDVNMSEPEISVKNGDLIIEGGEEVPLEIVTKLVQEEEMYHEEMPPKVIEQLELEAIKLCDSNIEDLDLSEEIKKSIKLEVDNYIDDLNLDKQEEYED